MTVVTVNPGNCGLIATIQAEEDEKRTVRISISSDCEMIERWAGEIVHVSVGEIFNPRGAMDFFKSALRFVRHMTCPVPLAVLKAAEAEVGFALPQDVHICYIDS